MQLVKLRSAVGRIRSLGAEVFAISSDRHDGARQVAADLRFTMPVLSNPGLDVVYSYSMKAPDSTTADMGYVLIDAAGRIRTRQIDHRLGDHAEEIVHALERIAQVKPVRE